MIVQAVRVAERDEHQQLALLPVRRRVDGVHVRLQLGLPDRRVVVRHTEAVRLVRLHPRHLGQLSVGEVRVELVVVLDVLRRVRGGDVGHVAEVGERVLVQRHGRAGLDAHAVVAGGVPRLVVPRPADAGCVEQRADVGRGVEWRHVGRLAQRERVDVLHHVAVGSEQRVVGRRQVRAVRVEVVVRVEVGGGGRLVGAASTGGVRLHDGGRAHGRRGAVPRVHLAGDEVQVVDHDAAVDRL